MDISDFIELVERNAYKPMCRWYSTRWGARGGAPPNTCTFMYNMKWWNHEDTLFEGEVYNVPTPRLPEYTVMDRRTGRKIAESWGSLLRDMVKCRVIRPSCEVERVLGTRQLDVVKREARLGCV